MKPLYLVALLLLLLVPRPHAPEAPAAPLGTIVGASTISAQQIDAVLASYGSPAAGTGATWVSEGNARGINAAYALAFFIKESSAATNPKWAGWKPDGSTTHNVGNIICTPGFPTCYGRFRDYATWDAGIVDWYHLIDVEYVQGRGLTTVAQIIPVYAPAFENDVEAYVAAVNGMVAGWQTENQEPINRDLQTQNVGFLPSKAEVISGMHINAGFYTTDCGTWGFQPNCQHLGTDIAGVDSEAVVAPFDGTCIQTGAYPDGPMGGQYVMYTLADGSELYLGHLRDAIDCTPGTAVHAGETVGRIRSDKLHVHVQLRNAAGALADFEQYYQEH